MYVFGNSEYAGFAFELNFAGRVCRQLDLSGFCAKPGHHIPVSFIKTSCSRRMNDLPLLAFGAFR
jgi:hypothetical protein